MAKILITGGTGLIGEVLENKLIQKNHEVQILTRNPRKENHFKWDIKNNYIDEKVFENLDYIIHLAGAGIADKKWTKTRKKELIDSRVESANLLFSKVTELKVPLKRFISSSGIGFYGAITTENIFTEEDKPASDFISEICIKWENAAQQFQDLDIPVTILRTGVVLSKDGGALQKMNTPLLLSALGHGKQYVPWIHIEDLCNLYVKATEDDTFIGIYNGIAPDHQTNSTFTKALGKALKKIVTPINVPGFILKTVLGELAVIVLEGSRISTVKTEEEYNFKFKTLKSAFEDIYNKKNCLK
ncbi:TIGR01777 family protein [Tenacibaculum sp. SZ-18]|uniref:TIGR01777 family oxidoreductase n=1 Tax=Tenacibaculum sp. SZ-18 TaxID=754423 RepID=UPI000C2D51DE|nr:TIGR01777 family oxidoreductase [Tenacibaculum sp. SZ-18]AUC14654.1 TIGR01777 family protein [Tenacibaculum sp. SZ-18]